ncbi:MAG: CsiV family protein [Gammaproteobacteria bacterium]
MRIGWVLIAVVVCWTAPAAAQDWYTVEVIVFEHRADASSQGEVWPRDPEMPDLDAATPILPPTEPRTARPFEQLRRDALRMGGAWRTLSESSRYQPLVHVGWRQPGLGPAERVPVRIDLASGDMRPVEPYTPPSQDGDAPNAFSAEGADQSPVDAVEPEPVVTNPWFLAEQLRTEYAAQPTPEPLVGTVTLLMQRFLHVGIDLLLTTSEPLPREDSDQGWVTAREEILADLTFELIGYDEARARLDALNATPRFEAYRLVEQRRVRTEELHYFDHPKFGVIVNVRPIPPEEIEALRAATDALEEPQAQVPPAGGR